MFQECEELEDKFKKNLTCLNLQSECVKIIYQQKKKMHILSIFFELQTSWTSPCWLLTPFYLVPVEYLLAGFKHKKCNNKNIHLHTTILYGKTLINISNYHDAKINIWQTKCLLFLFNLTLIHGCCRLSWIAILFLQTKTFTIKTKLLTFLII